MWHLTIVSSIGTGSERDACRRRKTRFTEVAGIERLVNERMGRFWQGGKPAVDVVGAVTAGDASAFVMLRLTAVPGHVVAICYSGTGVLTDADRGFFEQFCAHGVMIRQVVVESRTRLISGNEVPMRAG